MKNQIILAKKAMRLANKTDRKPLIKQVPRRPMPQASKPRRKPSYKKVNSLTPDYSQYIEKAILTTLVLAVMSVFYSQLAFLAGILSLLIIAAIIDNKLGQLLPANFGGEVFERPSQPTSKRPTRKPLHIESKSHKQVRGSDLFIPFDVTEVGGETLTMTVFPYKKSM